MWPLKGCGILSHNSANGILLLMILHMCVVYLCVCVGGGGGGRGGLPLVNSTTSGTLYHLLKHFCQGKWSSRYQLSIMYRTLLEKSCKILVCIYTNQLPWKHLRGHLSPDF